MMLLRNFVWGAILGVTVAVAVRPSTLRIVHVHEIAAASPREVAPPLRDATTVVDVAANNTTADLASLIRLAPGESIVAFDDHAMRFDPRWIVLRGSPTSSPGFVDLTTSAGRRIVVLFH
jgi:hypothetical protein